jgi:DNA-binding NtrC family response regulator
MASVWPSLVLIDQQGAGQSRLVDAVRALGVDFRALSSVPSGLADGNGAVRVALCASAATRALICRLRQAFPMAQAIIYGTDVSQTAAVDAFRAGADDFVAPERGAEDLKRMLANLLPASGKAKGAAEHGLIGPSMALAAVRDYALRLAPSHASVLISGETGTGKELLAALIHRQSRRANGPLVALNCAAIPEALLEGELFGYERGAFSGACAAYPGKLKLADGGTLLLDEIGELSLGGQAKILRALETGEAYRLGATKPTRFDVRIVSASNRDLATEIAAGRFREDLYYRLAVARVEMPPLRARPDDIAPIADRLLSELAMRAGLTPVRIDSAAMAALRAHAWPGNVRELRNVIEIAMVTARGGVITLNDVARYLTLPCGIAASVTDERSRLVDVLSRTHGNKSEAAKVLSCSRMTLYRKLARHGLVADGHPPV